VKSLIQPRAARGSATPTRAAGDSVAFFRGAFLRHTPDRHAVMLPPGAHRKYHEHPEPITDAQIRAHLAGQVTLAAPAACGGHAALLPLDLDAGGLPALLGLLDLVAARGLWAFGQYCPRPDWPEAEQRGYVWLPFDELADAQQLQLLGQELIASLAPPARAEARAHAGETRLPLGRHRHTGRFGTLLLPGLQLPLDLDPAAALAALRRAWRPNPIACLPPLPPPVYEPPERPPRPQGSSPPGQVSIERYNAEHDLISLLASYGATRAAGRAGRRLMHCCGHPDERRASLLLVRRRGSQEWLCRCLSQHQNCVLAGKVRDSFGVYCAMERLEPAEALRRLNGRG
jgi:hypothetical protein